MAGTLGVVQRGYAGAHIRDDVLTFRPHLPVRLEGLSFAMQFRHTPILVTLAGGRLTLVAHPEGLTGRIRVSVGDDVRDLHPGGRCTFDLRGCSRLSEPRHD